MIAPAINQYYYEDESDGDMAWLREQQNKLALKGRPQLENLMAELKLVHKQRKLARGISPSTNSSDEENTSSHTSNCSYSKNGSSPDRRVTSPTIKSYNSRQASPQNERRAFRGNKFARNARELSVDREMTPSPSLQIRRERCPSVEKLDYKCNGTRFQNNDSPVDANNNNYSYRSCNNSPSDYNHPYYSSKEFANNTAIENGYNFEEPRPSSPILHPLFREILQHPAEYFAKSTNCELTHPMVATSTREIRNEQEEMVQKSFASEQVAQEIGIHAHHFSDFIANDDVQEISQMANETMQTVTNNERFWYKPAMSRDNVIAVLRSQPSGSFLIRDSNSYRGAFGLAVKVGRSECRHYLIEPHPAGVRLKGSHDEPVFGSLASLVHQHTLTKLALPCRLRLPTKEYDTIAPATAPSTVASNVFSRGAACDILYVGTYGVECLTGSAALERACDQFSVASSKGAVIHLKVSTDGITLTDNSRKLFFRRHYPLHTITYCALAPSLSRGDYFGFVARSLSTSTNQCILLRQLDQTQPATAIAHFITKVIAATGSE